MFFQQCATASTEARTPSKDLINPGQEQQTCTDFKNNSFAQRLESPESCSEAESHSESSEPDEIEPILEAKRRKKFKSSKKNRLSLRRKAEALLRLAAKAESSRGDEKCLTNNPPQTTVTNFRLVLFTLH